MNPVIEQFPPEWLFPLWSFALLLAMMMLRNAEWSRLKAPGNLNVLLGATTAVLALWLIRAGIKPGLDFHLLGATALTLMFGPWFALFALGLINVCVLLWQGQLAAFPADWLLTAALPVTIAWRIFRFVDRRLTNHFFVYIFLNAFFGAAFAVGMVGLAATAFAAASGAYTLSYLLEEYLPFYLLMGWAEAFSTGMLITVLVVYRPQWIATFDDARYLRR
jgi:uncharacterized membrane protein